jgi:hypothetical protein
MRLTVVEVRSTVAEVEKTFGCFERIHVSARLHLRL